MDIMCRFVTLLRIGNKNTVAYNVLYCIWMSTNGQAIYVVRCIRRGAGIHSFDRTNFISLNDREIQFLWIMCLRCERIYAIPSFRAERHLMRRSFAVCWETWIQMCLDILFVDDSWIFFISFVVCIFVFLWFAQHFEKNLFWRHPKSQRLKKKYFNEHI